jgi:hypothetical protein
MARRRNDDTTPRNTRTIQVCLSEEDASRLKSIALSKFGGKVSVAARGILHEGLKVAS